MLSDGERAGIRAAKPSFTALSLLLCTNVSTEEVTHEH